MHVAFLVTGSTKTTTSMDLLVLPGFGNWEIVLKCLGREVKALEHRESGAMKMIESVGTSFSSVSFCNILPWVRKLSAT